MSAVAPLHNEFSLRPIPVTPENFSISSSPLTSQQRSLINKIFYSIWGAEHYRRPSFDLDCVLYKLSRTNDTRASFFTGGIWYGTYYIRAAAEDHINETIALRTLRGTQGHMACLDLYEAILREDVQKRFRTGQWVGSYVKRVNTLILEKGENVTPADLAIDPKELPETIKLGQIQIIFKTALEALEDSPKLKRVRDLREIREILVTSGIDSIPNTLPNPNVDV